ncbi:hypothetical protein SEUCBS139899_006583 [Sporothrix eucalyptigena]|uniref:Major facilitator superfamily (MFS) profile domain-containing protein n=1 Tax=Sporothrix eucalyptigena TaxID=1812306 RepID=A0ABP0B2L5_9PEZI
MALQGSPRNTPLLANQRILWITALMALANVQYGFDAAVIASFQAMEGFLEIFGYPLPAPKKGYEIATTTQQLITSFLNVGTIVGVLFTGPFSRYFGRRPGIWAGSLLGFAGFGVQLGARSVAGLCVGRALVGASNAFFITFANSYLAESAPAHLRSVCSGVLGVTTSVGGLLGTVVPYVTKGVPGRLCYQIGLACLFVFPTAMSVGALFIPESPRWLLVRGHPEKAERSLALLRGHSSTHTQFREELTEMVHGINEEKALASSSPALVDMFRGTDLRRSLLCIGTVTSRAASGIWVFISYGTYFYKQAGIHDPFAMSMYNLSAAIVGAVAAVLCSHFLFGRRTMILFATAAAVLSMMAAAIGGTAAPGSDAAAKNFVAFSVIYNVLYGSFAGSVTWPISAEVVSSRLRVLTLSVATAVDYVLAWLTAFCSPYFINPAALNWGVKYCWLWAGSNALAFLFFWFLLPEMKGRSLEEIDEMFEKRVRTKYFSTYECDCTRVATQDEAKPAALHV